MESYCFLSIKIAKVFFVFFLWNHPYCGHNIVSTCPNILSTTNRVKSPSICIPSENSHMRRSDLINTNCVLVLYKFWRLINKRGLQLAVLPAKHTFDKLHSNQILINFIFVYRSNFILIQFQIYFNWNILLIEYKQEYNSLRQFSTVIQESSN